MEKMIKSLKSTPLLAAHEQGSEASFHRQAIERMIPHRAPFLLIDKITHLNVAKKLIGGVRHIDAEDPILQGHFPGNPIYPGVLQIEMVAQLGLCLAYFMINGTEQVAVDSRPVMAMVTKVQHVAFHSPIFPKQHIAIYAQIIDYDGIIGTMIGQLYFGSQLCSYVILEAYFNE
jgi:3-hydroxyacyl-[acyl-carrier-protein] dehydratase